MGVRSKNVREALVFYEDPLEYRWLKALGNNVIDYELGAGEPTNATDSIYPFVTTVTEAGAGETVMVPSVVDGERLTITTDAAEYDGVNAQLQGSAFKLAAGLPLYFGARLKLSDATQSDMLIGLAELKTDLMKVSVAHGILATAVEGVFFTKVDSGTVIRASSYLNGVESAGANSTIVMDTNLHTYEIYWDGATVYFYVDGVLATQTAASLADGTLTPSINFRAGEAVAKTMKIAWMRTIQIR